MPTISRRSPTAEARSSELRKCRCESCRRDHFSALNRSRRGRSLGCCARPRPVTAMGRALSAGGSQGIADRTASKSVSLGGASPLPPTNLKKSTTAVDSGWALAVHWRRQPKEFFEMRGRQVVSRMAHNHATRWFRLPPPATNLADVGRAERPLGGWWTGSRFAPFRRHADSGGGQFAMVTRMSSPLLPVRDARRCFHRPFGGNNLVL